MGLKQRTLSGVKWNTVVTIIATIAQIVKISVVARYLDRSDFGLLAIVNMVVGFSAMFTDLGITTAMMHKQDISVKQYSTLYWFNWVLNLLIFLIICGAAPFIAAFYNDSRLTHLIFLMGLPIIITPFGKIFYTIKEKNLQFGFISKVKIIGNFLSVLLVIILVVLGSGIYSLVIASIGAAIFSAAVFSYAGRNQTQILFYFNFNEVRDFFKIGIYNMGQQILDFLAYKIDILLLGKFFGMDELGIYNLGKELILKPMKMISPIITKVGIPVFAKIQNDINAMKVNYIRILEILSFINFGVLSVLFAFAKPIVTFLYGENYIEVAVFVQILSIWGMFATIGNPAGVLMIAKGRTDLGFKWTLIRIIFAPIAIFIASFYSIEAVAYSQVILQFFFFFIYWKMMINPLSGISLTEYFGSVRNALISSLVGVASVFVFNVYYSGSTLFHLIYALPLFALVYMGTNILINFEFLSFLKSLVFHKSNK